MAATATAPCEEQVQVRRERRPCARPSGLTLGRLLGHAHELASAGGVADCPVCGGTLERYGLEAHCGDCGSRIG